MNKDPFKEYIKESEPAKRDKGYAWHTAIGLQAVDGLKTSEYLTQTAVRNIEGEISFEEANVLLQTYYEENPVRDASDRTEEADKVSARIAALLSERAFSFTPNEYLSIHRKLFTGIYSHAGRIRDYNITKREWVLNGATVLYGSATELRATLDYDFSEEKKFSYRQLRKTLFLLPLPTQEPLFYRVFRSKVCGKVRFFEVPYRQLRKTLFSLPSLMKEALFYRVFRSKVCGKVRFFEVPYRGLTMDEIIHHLAVFVSRLWQIHVFGEGNTRTTAVFFIKYLRTLGFDATNDIFAENAWYFRNALVRANYNDLKNGIHETTEFLERFLRNLLLNENHPLHNRTLHISGSFKKVGKPDIESSKPDIDALKSDIENAFRPKTASHVLKLRESFPGQTVFGRSDMMKIIDIKASRASDLLREMAEHGIIEPVSGRGKGKYRFRQR